MRALRKRVTAPVALAVAALAACGGGEILAVVGFVGSIGGDWNVDNPAVAGFQPRSNCGAGGNDDCVINIQPIGSQDFFATRFNVSFSGNLPGCPSTPATTGTVDGQRITLPNCFTGSYVTINEALSDDGSIRAFFDSAVPQLATGVWVEIQKGQRRFKFINDTTGCELTTPRTAVSLTIVPADLNVPRLQTEIVGFSIGGQVWTGGFVGMSGMRLTSGSQVLELERRDLPDVC